MPEPMSAEHLEVVKVAHDGRHHCNGWQHDPERPTWNPVTGGEGQLTGPCLPFRLAETALAALKRADEAEAHVRRVLAVSVGQVPHLNEGMCPDSLEGYETRDPECEACAALDGDQPAPEQPAPARCEAQGPLVSALCILTHDDGRHDDGRGTRWTGPAPEQPTHHTNDCDLLIRHRACSCGYAPDPFGRSADQ